MLLYLTNSLIVDNESEQFVGIKKAVRYIAMSVLESKHMLRGDYEVLGFFEAVFREDEDIFPVFHELVSKYSTYTVPRDICRYVEVVMGGFAKVERDGHCIRQMPYDYFDDSMKIQAMTLVTEDEADCALFEYIIKYYLKIHNLHYNYCFTSQGGGGSRTDVTVKSCLASGKMVTCITDSDQRYEGQPLDSDSCAVKCSKIKDLNRIYYFLMLPVLEVENLIPLNHINKLDWSQEQNKKDKAAFDKLCNNAHSELILPYFDMKEGIKKETIDRLGEGMVEFAAMCCHCNPNIMSGRGFHSYVSGLLPESMVYPRLKKRLMVDLAPLYKQNHMPDPELMGFQLDAWETVAKLLLDTTCARKKEAITV